MKILSFIIFTTLLLSCSKDKNGSNQACNFFPVYKGQKITYSSAVILNVTPDQIKYTDRAAVVTDSFLVVDNNIFYYADCAAEKIQYRNGSMGKVLLFDNSKSANSQIIYSDTNFTVTQHKDVANTMFSSVRKNSASYDLLTAVFVAGKGVTNFSTINEDSGNEATRFKLK